MIVINLVFAVWLLPEILCLSDSPTECASHDSIVNQKYEEMYSGDANRGIHGQRCEGSVESTEDYPYAMHNQFCRFTLLDKVNMSTNTPAKHLPTGVAWCYDKENMIIDCEILTCREKTLDAFLGEVRITKYSVSLLEYFGYSQFPDFDFPFYTFRAEYVACVVRRRNLDEGHVPERKVTSIYLKIKQADRELDSRRLVDVGKIGCRGFTESVIAAPHSTVNMRDLFSWNCRPSSYSYRKCTEEGQSPDLCYYYPNSRYPGGRLDIVEEELQFKANEPYYMPNNENARSEAMDYSEKLWGRQPSGDGLKYFSCEATLTDESDARKNREFQRLSHVYSTSAIYNPYNTDITSAEFAKSYGETHGVGYSFGYAGLEWSVEAELMKGEKFAYEGGRVKPGTLFKFTFNLQSGYDTQFYQIGLKFNYRGTFERVEGEVKEIGCDTKGNAFHVNAEEYMYVHEGSSSNNKDGMYYVDRMSRCSRIYKHVKRAGYSHSLYLRAFMNNSGAVTPFVRDMRSWKLYSKTIYNVQVYQRAVWETWGQWSSCGDTCTGPKDRERMRTRQCRIPLLGPYYAEDIYEEYLRLPNCTEIDGTVNSLLEEQVGLCWGNGECFTNNVGISGGLSATAVFNSERVDLLAGTDNPKPPYTMHRVYGNLESLTLEDRLSKVSVDGIEPSPFIFNETILVLRVPGNRTAQLAVYKDSVGEIQWTLDLDAAGVDASYTLSNVSLFKSQVAATECWGKGISPCRVDIFSGLARSTECQLGNSDVTQNRWYQHSNSKYITDANLEYDYLMTLDWALENNGRKAVVTLPFSKINVIDMGLYQPRAYISSSSNPDNEGWVALTPLLDLKIDSTSAPSVVSTGLSDYQLREHGSETYPLMITVRNESDSTPYALSLALTNLVEIPEVLEAGVTFGCRKPAAYQYPMNLKLHISNFQYAEGLLTSVNFYHLELGISLDVSHTGADIVDHMNQYGIFSYRLKVRHNGKVYPLFESRRLWHDDGDASSIADLPHYRKWPQTFSEITKEKVHDEYVCPNVKRDGGWTEWSRLTTSQTCDQLIETWGRKCTNPYPFKGGAECSGSPRFVKKFPAIPCEPLGDWLSWNSWSTCEEGCGQCIKRRTRECGENSLCEVDARKYEYKATQTSIVEDQVSCDGDCTADIDCRGMAAPAVCDGNPRKCRFLCQDSMHCANGVCADVKRWSGDTVSVCIDQCDDDHSCPQSQSCIGRRCVNMCSNDSDCSSSGEHCSSVSGHCTRACSSASSCQARYGPLGTCFTLDVQSEEKECVIGCLEDKDCTNIELSCVLGMCIPNIYKDNYTSIDCTNDTSCPFNAVCSIDTNVCVDPLTVTCGDDQSCGSAAQCDGGNCRRLYNYNKTCSNDSQCSYIETCENGVCVVQQDNNGRIILPTEGCTECDTRLSDSICDDNKCQCPSGLSLYAGRRCGYNPPEDDVHECQGSICALKCRTPSDCPFNHFCHKKICREGCYVPPANSSVVHKDSCPEGMSCHDQLCKVECSGSSQCFTDQECVSGLCHDTCINGRDDLCQEGYICSNELCILACEESSECEGNEMCYGGNCLSRCSFSSDCGDGKQCQLGVCTASCKRHRDCSGDLTCVGGICAHSCVDNSQCNSNLCVEGFCSVACDSSEICGNWTCNNGECAMPCNSNSDCHLSQKCAEGSVCRTIIGTSCSGHYECNYGGRSYSTNLCIEGVCQVDFRPGASCISSTDCGLFGLCKSGACVWPTGIKGKPWPSHIVGCDDYNSNCSLAIDGGACTEDGVCGCVGNKQLLNNLCIPEILTCYSPGDCPANQICQDGMCQRICQSEVDCEGGQVCLHGGVCGFSCSSRYGCPFGTRCLSGRCEKQCTVSKVKSSECADSLQICLHGICRSKSTDATGCVAGTILRSGVCVSECNKDSDCLDICVVGACSSSCSSTRPCPSEYSCMSGRCFAECDVGVENVCGLDEKFQCRIGVSNSLVGTGICVYETEYPPISHKDYSDIIKDISCDLVKSAYQPVNKKGCGPDGGKGMDKPDSPGFFVDNTLAMSCSSDEDCGLDSLYCTNGFCSNLCYTNHTGDCGDPTVCGIPDDSASRACLIRCDSSTKNCPPKTACDVRDGVDVCVPLLYKSCLKQEDCLDSTGSYLYCDELSSTCIPYENVGEPCLYQSQCGLGTYCSRVCRRYTFILPIHREKCESYNIVGLVYNVTYQKCHCPAKTVLYGNRCLPLNGLADGFFDVCSTDNECPKEGVCVGFLCLKRCTGYCSEGYNCVQGTCQPLCTTDDECPDEVTCSFGSCTPVCADNSPTDTCGSGGKCISGSCYEYPVSDPTRCTDQGLVHYEPEEVCLYPCTLDSECPHSACAGGVCSTTCSRANPDCAEGRECVSGRCHLKCHPSSSDCPATNSSCINWICSSPCAKESDCTGYSTCVRGHCVERCEVDYDCSHFLSGCHEGVCTHRCTAADECVPGYECDLNGEFRCTVKCSSDAQCSVYQTCDTEKRECISSVGVACTGNEDCGKNHLLYCSPITGKCEPMDKEGAPCKTQNCGLNEVCTSKRECELRVDWNGSPTVHPDKAPGTIKKRSAPNEDCRIDSECREEDEICISNHCYSTADGGEAFGGCAVDDPLPQRLVSSDGLQMLTCESSADCDSNQLCVDCVCAAKCMSNKDCTDFQKCFEGMCMERCSLEGNCNSLTDVCVDGLCRDQCNEDSNEDLAYGSCSGGVINPICHAAAPCPPGYICEKYVCEKLCNDVDDCAQRQVCGLSTCTTECSDVDSTNCVNGTKVNTCYSHLDCGLNRYCILGVCSPKCTCERNGNCDVSPCDTIGWLCDAQTGGCVPKVIEEKVTEEEIIGTGCQAARDCKHYNLYCNLDTQQCVPVRPVSGGATCNQQTDVSFCGVNGECVEGSCDCIRNGAGECIGSPPQPCNKQLEGDASCSHGQVCDSAYDWCVCPKGSVILGEDCVEVIPYYKGLDYFGMCYSHTQCPIAASCMAGNCYPHCTENCNDYPGLRCYAGHCMMPCTVTSDCDRSQYCSSEGICLQKCVEGGGQCGRNQYCINGECQQNCYSDYDCEVGSVCANRICVKSCVFDVDCPKVCVHGLCGGSCTSHTDCKTGTSCQNGKCVQKCTVAKNCAATQVCLQGYCASDCSPKEDGCRESCTDSTQCAQGLTCTHGICSAPCSMKSDCGDGFLCDDGTCVIACTEDEDKGETPICPSHLYCEFKDGYCKTPTGDLCDSSSDCDIGSYCSGRLCRDGTHLGSKCKTEKDCGLEELCVLGVCECLRAYHGECVEYPIACASINSEISGQSYCDTRLPQSTCNPDNNWCLCEYPYQRLGDRCVAPPSEFCIDGCPYGFECRGYKCYQKCDSTVISCPRGMSCVNGYCDYTCEYDSNCNNGQMCECGYCTNICTDNTECLSGQICNQGVCRESCSQSLDAESCSARSSETCQRDDECGAGNSCFDGTCLDSCVEEVYQCATYGFTCQKGVCMKTCDDKVSCKALPGEVNPACGCPEPRANEFDDCLLYEVFCPPTTYEPEGFVLADVSEAKDCSDLIADSECNRNRSICVCKQGMVQYAGAVCQQQLPGCDPDKADCPDNHDCDNGHCYKRCSTGSDCSEYTLCNPDSGLCQLICDDDKNCLGHQTCKTIEGVKRVCVAKDTSVVKGANPECSASEGGGEVGDCEVSTTEKCNQDGYCECIEGMRRSSITLQCEWLMDIVCLSCPPCLAKCPDRNMRCSEESRLCMCVEGFKLDESGKSCTKDDFTVTEMNCDSTADCNLLPNSYCNERFGKCQCRTDYCYKDKYCQPDWNECEGSSCENQTTCVDLNCLQPPGTCIPTMLTGATATTNKPCSVESDCAEFGQLTYCFSGRCTCVSGSFLIENQCKAVQLCSSVKRCPYGMKCEAGLCTGTRSALAASTDDRETEEKKAQVSWPAVIISCLLAIGIIATIIVAIYTKREYELKNSTEFDDSEIKSKVEFRRSSIAGKRDALQRRLSTATTIQAPPDVDLAAADYANPDEPAVPAHSEGYLSTADNPDGLTHFGETNSKMSVQSREKAVKAQKSKSAGGKSSHTDDKKSHKAPKSVGSSGVAKSKELVSSSSKSKSQGAIEDDAGANNLTPEKNPSRKSAASSKSKDHHDVEQSKSANRKEAVEKEFVTSSKDDFVFQ